jgi:hypothetical protein
MKGKGYSEILGTDINASQRNRVGNFKVNVPGSRLGPVMGSCEHNNEPFGSIKGMEFLD